MKVTIYASDNCILDRDEMIQKILEMEDCGLENWLNCNYEAVPIFRKMLSGDKEEIVYDILNAIEWDAVEGWTAREMEIGE